MNINNVFNSSTPKLFKQNFLVLKVKCKATPLQAWTGPEDSRRLRLPDIKTVGT